jgi:hypothetical protein
VRAAIVKSILAQPNTLLSLANVINLGSAVFFNLHLCC